VLSLVGVEVGIKSLIPAVIPGSGWLVENLSSPALERAGRALRAHAPQHGCVLPYDPIQRKS
jgi:hypothetical protein